MRVGGQSPGVEVVPQEAAGLDHDAAVATKSVVFNWHGTGSRRIIAIAQSQNLKCANNIIIPCEICPVATQNPDLDRDGATALENTLGSFSVDHLVKSSKGRVPENTIGGKLAQDSN